MISLLAVLLLAQPNDMISCHLGGQSIPLSGLNDGICDCCDGSDEISNLSLFCPNTCKVALTQGEISKFRTVFDNAIIRYRAVEIQSNHLYQELKESIEKLSQELNVHISKYNKLVAELESAKSNLRSWVYQVNGISLPSDEEIKKRKLQYINKIDNLPSRHHSIDEEEGEDEAPQMDTEAFEKRKKSRASKWEEIQSEEWNNLLGKALEISKPKSDFISRLRSLRSPEAQTPYTKYTSINGELNITQEKIKETQMQLSLQSSQLKADHNPNHIWLSAPSDEMRITLDRTQNVFRFSLRSDASILVTEDKRVEIGFDQVWNGNTVVFGPGPKSFDGKKWAARIKFVCFPELRLFNAFVGADARIQAVAGAPEACENLFSEDSFQSALRELQFFKDSIIGRREL